MARSFILILVGLLLRDAKCLASSSSSISRILSVRKNGGDVKTMDLTTFRGKEKPKSKEGVNLQSVKEKVVSAVRSTFLPSGYPSRTPDGYLQYCIFSWIQDISTQLRSVLATQRVLEGVGVGREGATALSALMNFLIRDGCGMAATLLFTSASSSKFRTDVKRWRLFADLMVDLGITLEVMAVLVPRTLFLPMISVGNMCKAMCGVAAGACGGSINLFWARGSDISDINAKFGAQHTVTGALGLVFAASFAKSVDHVNTRVLWSLYILLTIVHLWANARCMRLISFDSCNTARMNLLLKEFFESWNVHHAQEENPILPTLSTPKEIAQKEPLLFVVNKASRPSSGSPIRLGVPFDEYWAEHGNSDVTDIEKISKLPSLKDKYIISATESGAHVVLLSHVSGRQEAKAYFHADFLAWEAKRSTRGEIKQNYDDLLRAWNCFERCLLAAGWDIEKTELSTVGYEVKFEND